ncbi:MAG: hypothetical protein E7566_03050 [Ruminococcaceae bacterium]|nr:hypothetical protein [Oscillospiraceae bacterium]
MENSDFVSATPDTDNFLSPADENVQLQRQNEMLKKEIAQLKIERQRIKQTRTRLSVFLLILLLISMVTTTFAWFTISSISSVHNMEITIGTGVQLLISDENHGDVLAEYTNAVTEVEINKQLAVYDTSMDDMELDPLTSSDGVNLFTEHGNIPVEANKNTFLEFELFFIATEDMWVHLTPNESEPGAEDGTMVFTSSTGVQADIVNCVRVSFTDEEAGTTVIYEPNKGTMVADQNTFDLTGNFSNATRLFHLDPLSPKNITVRIWIEGEDPQCDDDVQKANLQMQFNFEGTDENNIPVN